MKKVALVLSAMLIAGMAVSNAEETGSAQEQHAAKALVERAAGKVSADRVNIRSGPSTSNNIIITVDKNTELQVRSFSDGWYEVDLPKGSGCWVYKEYIKVDAPEAGFEAGAALPGIIIGTNVRLRAAPDMLASSVLTETNKGDKVDVIGKSGDWFKVRPPEGATGWISAKYVTLTEGVRVKGEMLPGEAAKAVISDSDVPLPSSAQGDITIPPLETTPGKLPALSNLSRAEHIMADELKRPPLQRDFSEAITLYNKVITSISTTAEEKKAAQARLKQIFILTPRRELASYMIDLSRKIEDELKKSEKRYEPQIEALRSKIPPSRYTARGLLYSASGESAGVRYRLKMGDVTLYLLKTTTRRYDGLVGKEVGVIGEVFPPPSGFDIEMIEVASMEQTR